MTRTLLTTILLIFGFNSYSQSVEFSDGYVDKKYVIWYSPSRATHVYGLMINLLFKESATCYPTTYGVELNINPLGLFAPVMILLGSLDTAFNSPPSLQQTDTTDFSKFKKINGLHIALLNMEPTVINGLNINAFASRETVTNGLTLSLLSNKEYKTNGATIALFGNHSTRCKGVQIGIHNTCRQLKGVQFGLWNKNQKRSLPLINWCW